jgi:general secretion pathway protein I
MKTKTAGFTLIEVLIALAILSISLTAVIKATSQNIRDTFYIQNKMIAHWVGINLINEARAGLLKLPTMEQDSKQEVIMLGQHWQWEGHTSSSPNSQIKEIHIAVFAPGNHAKLARLTSYLYVAK